MLGFNHCLPLCMMLAQCNVAFSTSRTSYTTTDGFTLCDKTSRGLGRLTMFQLLTINRKWMCPLPPTAQNEAEISWIQIMTPWSQSLQRSDQGWSHGIKFLPIHSVDPVVSRAKPSFMM